MGRSTVKRIAVMWHEIFKPITGLNSDIRNIVEVEREVIPIVFVPGIMGSRLKLSTGGMAWDPDSRGFMVNNYGRRRATAKKRKMLLVGNRFDSSRLQVCDGNSNSEHNAKLADKNDRTRVDRGWGGVFWESYGPILTALQTRQWAPVVNLCFELPVHAFGYNWTACNDEAGEKLGKYIAKIKESYKKDGRICNQVIVVTHSMGGLVARAACMLHNAKQNVLGVIHGVQPAMGAGAAYWRMKAGFERPQGGPKKSGWDWWDNPLKMLKHKAKGTIGAWVLGTNGEEVTSLLGNMPGGLELLPNKLYKDNDASTRWLKFVDGEGKRRTLPASNPYAEIYLERNAYYRLVNPDWLDPGKTKSPEDSVLKPSAGPWKAYSNLLSQAASFHERLGEQFHPNSCQFYASGLDSADKVVYTRSPDTLGAKGKRIIDIIKKDLPGALIKRPIMIAVKMVAGFHVAAGSELLGLGQSVISGAIGKDTDWYVNRGGYRDRADKNDKLAENKWFNMKGDVDLVTLEMPTGSGDGTVPVSSARALKMDKGRTIEINDTRESFFERGHEPIYKTETAQKITFTAIENLCREKIRRETGKK